MRILSLLGTDGASAPLRASIGPDARFDPPECRGRAIPDLLTMRPPSHSPGRAPPDPCAGRIAAGPRAPGSAGPRREAVDVEGFGAVAARANVAAASATRPVAVTATIGGGSPDVARSRIAWP